MISPSFYIFRFASFLRSFLQYFMDVYIPIRLDSACRFAGLDSFALLYFALH